MNSSFQLSESSSMEYLASSIQHRISNSKLSIFVAAHLSTQLFGFSSVPFCVEAFRF